MLTFRGETSDAPRDNVIFEMGLFMGALGREKVFLIAPDKGKLKEPSDLGGVKFEKWLTDEGNFESAVRTAASSCRSTMENMWREETMTRNSVGGGLVGHRTPDGNDGDVWLRAYKAGVLEELKPKEVKANDRIVHPRWGPGVVTEVGPGGRIQASHRGVSGWDCRSPDRQYHAAELCR